MQLIQHTESVWTIEEFLTPGECDELVALSENIGYDEAEVSFPSGPTMMKGLRNNYRLLYKDDQLAQRLWEKLQPYVPKEIENAHATGLNEQFRFYRYENAQRFKRHIDGRFKRNEQEESRVTFMIYLNNGFEGGETAFDTVTIMPKTGTALCFVHELKHEGCPVLSGTKYVLRSDVMYGKYGYS